MGTLFPSALRDGLSAQTSLKYLRFWCYSGCMDLPANALPNLRFLHSSPSFWSEFTSGRLDFLQPVKSLKLEAASVTHMRDLIRHLKSIEFLWLTVEDPETLAIRGIAPPTVKDYLDIPSQSLRYCNVGKSSFSIEDYDRMFAKFAHLKVVDICSSSNCEPMVVTRFIRDASSPVVTVIPTPKKWEQWWEIIRRDLEA
ncbi:hypothetical protein ONZ45_g3055 [Pleurotus djamor]|nr:hypothetical protein ONZ45_g3055 [Pleurotus djamor]